MDKTKNVTDIFSNMFQQMQGGKPTVWWQSFKYPETVRFEPDNLICCARSALYAIALMGGVVYEKRVVGDFNSLNIDNLEKLIKGLDGRLIYFFNDDYNLDLKKCMFYIFNDGAIFVHEDGKRSILSIVTINEKKYKLFNRHQESCIKKII